MYTLNAKKHQPNTEMYCKWSRNITLNNCLWKKTLKKTLKKKGQFDKMRKQKTI